MNKILTLLVLFLGAYSFGQSWQDVGGGTNNSSHGMLVWDGKLVNLGSYNNPCQRVSTWDGTAWNCLGGGVGIVARAGCVWQGKLVVVGDFWNNFQPCVGCNGVAVWDGVSWTALDQGFNNDVLTCTVWNGELIIGGDFTQANGVPISRVARWDELSSTFVGMGNPTSFGNDVRCMTEYDGDLWVGGDFNNVDGCSPCDGLVKWDDTNQLWEGGNSGVDLVGGVNESVRVLYVNPNDGNLYMGGEFPELHDGDAVAEDFNMSGIAMYDGSNWFSLGTGLNEYCRAIHEYNGNLIAGGYFTDAGGTPANKIAKWDPISSTWSAMGLGFDASGIDEYVKSATVWNGIFFAGGAYTQAEGAPMNYIAQWYEPVVDPPTAGISASSTSICEGDCVNFMDNSSNVPTSWTWNFPGGSIAASSDENPGQVCFANAGTYTVQLQACNGFGCDITTIDMTVTASPTLAVPNQSICEGETVILTATPSVSGGDYDWQPTNETTQTISVSPTSSTTYTVQYNLNGCSSSIETATVLVTQVPSLTVDDEVICEGDIAILTAIPDVSGGSYNWVTTGENTSSISVNPAISTAFQVSYTVNGCESPTVISNVTVNPVYDFSESLAVCPGSTVVYPDLTSESVTTNTAHTSNLTSIYGCDSIIITNVSVLPTYSDFENVSICSGEDFTYPDGTVSSDINIDESHVSNLLTTEGCDSVVTTNITVMTGPIVTVNESGNTLSANQTGATYQWVDCSTGFSEIIGETNQNFSPVFNGAYAVIVSLNGCSDTSECLNVAGIGIEAFTATFKIYPNPANHQIKIQYQEFDWDKNYKIYDGKMSIVQEGYAKEDIIDISSLANGLYFVEIGALKKRFIKL